MLTDRHSPLAPPLPLAFADFPVYRWLPPWNRRWCPSRGWFQLRSRARDARNRARDDVPSCSDESMRIGTDALDVEDLAPKRHNGLKSAGCGRPSRCPPALSPSTTSICSWRDLFPDSRRACHDRVVSPSAPCGRPRGAFRAASRSRGGEHAVVIFGPCLGFSSKTERLLLTDSFRRSL